MANIISKTIFALTLLAAGCDSAPQLADTPKTRTVAAISNEPDAPLRIKVDSLRNRVWVLRAQDLTVYDQRTNQAIRRIALPAWSVADFVCEPDLAIDRAGSLYISHNLEPKVWQINGVSFELVEHTVRLIGKESLDIGFSRLSFAPDGALYGVASSGGSVWRIDLASGTAQHVRTDRQARDDCSYQ